MYIYPCSRLNMHFFSGIQTHRSTPPPTILGLYIVLFQILRVIYLKKNHYYYYYCCCYCRLFVCFFIFSLCFTQIIN